MKIKNSISIERYPDHQGDDNEPDNVAIKLYGRRFYKDQTPVEYLAEFLLVFASAKGEENKNEFSFNLPLDKIAYFPKGHVPLKLFTFFPTSKLETRHPVHQKSYLKAINLLSEKIDADEDEKDEAVKLLQSLFAGFVGVSKNRTWVTHSFLPVCSELLGREIDWEHSKAIKESLNEWKDTVKNFSINRHNFMGRGGEVLFLQLSHLFSQSIEQLPIFDQDAYVHLRSRSIQKLKIKIENNLKNELSSFESSINLLGNFIETTLDEFNIEKSNGLATLGWAPVASLPEAFLFACEIDNIMSSSLGTLEKLDLLRQLCCLHVLRSLCCQAKRYDHNISTTHGFFGNYPWVVSDINSSISDPTRLLAQKSVLQIEEMLFRVLRIIANTSQLNSNDKPTFDAADKHGFQIFRKIAKEIDFVVPKTGQGARFVLTPGLLRLLVAALLQPNEKIRLTEFYERTFAHFGIALGEKQLAIALQWDVDAAQINDYAVSAQTEWVEETLRQGGLLAELSDAVSIVFNPS